MFVAESVINFFILISSGSWKNNFQLLSGFEKNVFFLYCDVTIPIFEYLGKIEGK